MTATQHNDRRVRRRTGLAAALLAITSVVGTTFVGAGLTAAPATAAAAPISVRGQIGAAWQSRVNDMIHLRGVAFDRSSPHESVKVTVFVNGRAHQNLMANRSSAAWNRGSHLHGRHAFAAVIGGPARARRITLVVHRARHAGRGRQTDAIAPRRVTPTGEKIVSVARRYVGSRYVYGADGPHAFDCSGYSKFVYRRADAGALPHNSQSQRHAGRMHRITRAHARAGDLVFYLSGRSAYHVSIYAGHGNQYSATNPRRGVEHDRISSRHVVFGTNWH